MNAPDTLTSASEERTVIAAVLEAAIEEIRREQADIRAELKSNTEVTAEIKEMTAEMVDLFTAAKGFFKMAGWIGTGIKWVSGVAAALAALWLVFKGGFPPRG